MIDRSFFLSSFFSLGMHGALVSFLIPPLMKIPSINSMAIEVVWESKNIMSSKTVSFEDSSVRKAVQQSLPKNRQAQKQVITKDTSRQTMTQIVNKSMEGCLESPSDLSGPKLGKHDLKKDQKATPSLGQSSQKSAYKPLPEYPWICRKRGQEGVVALKVRTDDKGRVKDVFVYKSSGFDRLDESALQAVQAWVFSEGKFEKVLSVAFRLKG
jgi:TonB family protein